LDLGDSFPGSDFGFVSDFGFRVLDLSLAASPGIAPGPPVSETGTLLIMPRGREKWDDGFIE